MTIAVPEGVAALRVLAEARPDLAGRISSLTAALAHVEPRAAEPRAGSVDSAVRDLVRLGVVDAADAAEADADPAALSLLAHRALDRAVAPDGRGIEVGDRVAELALVLGQRFEPYPVNLLDFFARARSLDLAQDLLDQLAWLAGHRGADKLVDGLLDLLGHEPIRVLDFLDAVAGSYGSYPVRASPDFSETPGRPGSSPIIAFPPPGTPGAASSIPPSKPARLRSIRRLRAFVSVRRQAAALSRLGAALLGPPSRLPEIPAIVSTGFCPDVGAPGLPPNQALAVGRRYEFFVEIGDALASDAIDTGDTPLPPLAAGTVLQVALFGFGGELQPLADADVGELRLVGDGSAIVAMQPGGEPGGRRLYLPVVTPAAPGICRMRCNIYCRQVLLQSRVIEAEVTAKPGVTRDGALRATLDFAVVSDLAAEHLEALQPRTLSVLVNDNGDGTHGFRFFAGREFKRDFTLTGEAVTQELEKARKGLRRVSWDTEEEPTREQFEMLTYRYDAPSREALTRDLAVLARSGFGIWDLLVDQLSGGDVDALAEKMKPPGRVEFANKQSLDLLVPAACVYDYPLHPEERDLTVCPSFLQALGVTPIASLPCFNGMCPSYADPSVVCPSGFWGFRHQIGYSASLTGGDSADAVNHALAVGATPRPVFTVGASADEALTQRDEHLGRLRSLAGDGWHFAWSRTDLFTLFQETEPSVVYLYGHGGVQGTSPYFEVGSGDDGAIIRSSLRGRADWRATRPLVFLNGCRSAALSPASAFSYATGFLQTAHASAVIGTEIAVFESLAVAFAEGCLRRFVTERQSLGEAVRATRLALLENSIPLGLAYLAFGPLEVRLAGS